MQYHREGRSVRSIAKTLTLPKSTVQDCVSRFNTTGSGKSRPRSGRPRVTDKRHDNRLRRVVMNNPPLSSSQLKESLQSPASTRTIRRSLVKEFNLRQGGLQRNRCWRLFRWRSVMNSARNTNNGLCTIGKKSFSAMRVHFVSLGHRCHWYAVCRTLGICLRTQLQQ